MLYLFKRVPVKKPDLLYESYLEAGAKIVETAEEIYKRCDLVAKVKEIEETEYGIAEGRPNRIYLYPSCCAP